MSAFLDEIGITEDYDARNLDERMEAGGMVPPGKYHAVLHTANKVESKTKGTPGWELGFKISSGAFAGSDIKETLYITDNPRSRDRLALFGSRLGLLSRTQEGRLVIVEGKDDFRDCNDTPCIIEIHHEKYERDDGTEGKSARITFGGIFDAKDPKALKAIAEQAKNGGTANKSTAANATKEKSPPAKSKPSVDDQLKNL